MAVGAALALDGSGRLPVAVLGDGDFLMGGTAIWTAARYRLPLLIVVANNSSFLATWSTRSGWHGNVTGRQGTPGSARPFPTPIRIWQRLPVR